jgi:hypothetical protein
MDLTAMKGDYLYAFHGFTIKFTGDYSTDRDGNITLTGNWEFHDRYFWQAGKSVTLLGTVIKDDWALLVEKYMGAAQFDSKGTYTGDVTFSKAEVPVKKAATKGY